LEKGTVGFLGADRDFYPGGTRAAATAASTPATENKEQEVVLTRIEKIPCPGRTTIFSGDRL
ncbi:MAG: hypothetical protein WDA72_05195, partial [Desulfomonilia bacterium]